MNRQRTKQQRGYIFRKGRFWFVRYSDTVLRDGKCVRVQLCSKLAPFSDAYRSERSVRPLAAELLQPINAGTLDVRSTMPVSFFIEAVYLPEIKERNARAHTKIIEISLEFMCNLDWAK